MVRSSMVAGLLLVSSTGICSQKGSFGTKWIQKEAPDTLKFGSPGPYYTQEELESKHAAPLPGLVKSKEEQDKIIAERRRSNNHS